MWYISIHSESTGISSLGTPENITFSSIYSQAQFCSFIEATLKLRKSLNLEHSYG